MNWKELYALVNENIKNAVSGLYKPAGDVTFAELPELSQSVLGYTYTVTDAFTTDSRFTDYDTETQTGHSFPADTEVAVIVTGTTENLVYMFNVMGGIMDGYATKGDLDNYVEKEAGKGLSTNDYTDNEKALVQNSPITTTATGSDLTLSTSGGNINALTIFGKSEVVDGSIKSAGEGWTTVDLGTLTWVYHGSRQAFATSVPFVNQKIVEVDEKSPYVCSKYATQIAREYSNWTENPNKSIFQSPDINLIAVIDTDYTDATTFKAAMSGVLLCYQLSDPTQGNTIAVKTDNGTGIDGTMAVFETGTPLYGVSDTVRDAMNWDGSAGTVTKNCGEVDLGTLNWSTYQGCFYTTIPTIEQGVSPIIRRNILCSKYNVSPNIPASWTEMQDKTILKNNTDAVFIKDTDYETPADFKTAMSGITLIYSLATPTTEQLTTAENASIAALRTFEPQTHAQNNAGAEMTVEAYAGTENGKAVSELKQDVQSEISALKITQSATLTLTVADWSSNQQTVTYAHDTAKRNVIDVDPASVEEWAAFGVLAAAETASGITFTCKTVPTNALSFRVTSMGVN